MLLPAERVDTESQSEARVGNIWGVFSESISLKALAIKVCQSPLAHAAACAMKFLTCFSWVCNFRKAMTSFQIPCAGEGYPALPWIACQLASKCSSTVPMAGHPTQVVRCALEGQGYAFFQFPTFLFSCFFISFAASVNLRADRCYVCICRPLRGRWCPTGGRGSPQRQSWWWTPSWRSCCRCWKPRMRWRSCALVAPPTWYAVMPNRACISILHCQTDPAFPPCIKHTSCMLKEG